MDISNKVTKVIGGRVEATGCSKRSPMAPDCRSVPLRWRRARKDTYLQPQEAPPYTRRRHLFSAILSPLLFLNIVLGVLIAPAAAAFVNFENCLSPNIINSDPLQLQFIPLHFYANFNTTSPSHNLNVTVYGNVSGIATQVPYPAPNDPQWSNQNATVGKIVDLSEQNNKYSTLFAKFNMLSYTPYDATPSRFCNSTVHGKCPLGPAFTANAYVEQFIIADMCIHGNA